MTDKNAYIHPEHIQIETIAGICTARCVMCPMHEMKRPYHVMEMDDLEKILKKLKCFTGQRYLSLHGNSEPLLDKEIHLKVSLAKKLGYRGVGFASNCTELSPSMALKLLDAGLNTLICSIDGLTKAVHEKIRLGTSFDKVVANVLNFLKVRNKRNAKTRVLVRLIRQASNRHEWEDYQKYWQERLNPEVGDGVIRFDVHNWSGDISIENAEDTDGGQFEQYCYDLLNRFIIDSTGRVALCGGDYKHSFDLGNALTDDPLELYNRPPFTTYRKAMSQGGLRKLLPCAKCDIPINRQTRILSETLDAK